MRKIILSTTRARLAPAVLATALGLGLAAPAAADSLILAPQTCTTLNCGALTLPGRINGHPASPAIANTWNAQFAGQASSCLRFQLTSETTNLAMTVVGPQGTVYTNDNGGAVACTQCPIVVVGAAVSGFYNVVIATRAGTGVEAAFTLRAGLYNSGNAPNCTGATPGR